MVYTVRYGTPTMCSSSATTRPSLRSHSGQDMSHHTIVVHCSLSGTRAMGWVVFCQRCSVMLPVALKWLEFGALAAGGATRPSCHRNLRLIPHRFIGYRGGHLASLHWCCLLWWGHLASLHQCCALWRGHLASLHQCCMLWRGHLASLHQCCALWRGHLASLHWCCLLWWGHLSSLHW